MFQVAQNAKFNESRELNVFVHYPKPKVTICDNDKIPCPKRDLALLRFPNIPGMEPLKIVPFDVKKEMVKQNCIFLQTTRLQKSNQPQGFRFSIRRP